MSNPFALHSVMEHLLINAPTRELGTLRQISTSYNKIMSSTYFDELDKVIYVIEPKDFGMMVSLDKDAPPNNKYVDAVIKPITHKTWDPALAPVFRRIVVNGYLLWTKNTANDLLIWEILPALNPFVTKLKFAETFDETDIFDKNCENENFVQKIATMIGTFENLKTLKFYLTEQVVDSTVCMKMIQNLRNPSTTIIYKYTPSLENMEFGYEHFSNWLEMLKSCPNPTFFDFEFNFDNTDDSFDKLEVYTSKTMPFISKIRNITVDLTFQDKPVLDPVPFHYCITQLSPYLTKFHFYQHNPDQNYKDFISATTCFPKLKNFKLVTEYNQNLEFLKSSPNLKQLTLGLDYSSNFFDVGKSDKEIIKLFFSHFKKLKKLELFIEEADKIQPGNELCNYLKTIIPSDTVLEIQS